IQAKRGSDIAMVFDECVAYPSDLVPAREAMLRALRGPKRSRDRLLALKEKAVDGGAMTNPDQAQFGIVQGSVYAPLREQSACETVAFEFDAYAIGGLSVGEPTDEMYEMVRFTTGFLPADRPRSPIGT